MSYEAVMIESAMFKAHKGPKKTFIKRKPTKLAKKPLKGVQGKIKAKKTPEKKLKAILWQLCKEIIRKQYGNSCYTCGAEGLTGGNWHTAHFIASSICGAYLRYDLRNLRPGCYRCNVSLAGNGAVFYKNLVEREGQTYVDGIFADKTRITKLNRAFLEEKIAEYQAILLTPNK